MSLDDYPATFKFDYSVTERLTKAMEEAGIKEKPMTDKSEVVSSPADKEPNKDWGAVHYEHCFKGEYADTCKYSDWNCPARPVSAKPADRITLTLPNRNDFGADAFGEACFRASVQQVKDCNTEASSQLATILAKVEAHYKSLMLTKEIELRREIYAWLNTRDFDKTTAALIHDYWLFYINTIPQLQKQSEQEGK